MRRNDRRIHPRNRLRHSFLLSIIDDAVAILPSSSSSMRRFRVFPSELYFIARYTRMNETLLQEDPLSRGLKIIGISVFLFLGFLVHRWNKILLSMKSHLFVFNVWSIVFSRSSSQLILLLNGNQLEKERKTWLIQLVLVTRHRSSSMSS